MNPRRKNPLPTVTASISLVVLVLITVLSLSQRGFSQTSARHSDEAPSAATGNTNKVDPTGDQKAGLDMGTSPQTGVPAVSNAAARRPKADPIVPAALVLGLTLLLTIVTLVLVILKSRQADERMQEIVSQLELARKDAHQRHDDILRQYGSQSSTLGAKIEQQVSGLRQSVDKVKSLGADSSRDGADGSRHLGRDDWNTAPAAGRSLSTVGATPEQIKQMLDPISSRMPADLSNDMQSVLKTLAVLRRQIVPEEGAAPLSLRDLIAQAPDPSDPLVMFGKRVQSVQDRLLPSVLSDGRFLDDLAEAIFEPMMVPLAPADQTPTQAQYRALLLPAIEKARSQAAAKARGFRLELMPIVKRQTQYDPKMHTAIRGTEMPTDRTELNGKVAEAWRSGFLMQTPQGLRVIRKAEVRLYRLETPSPVLPPSPIPVQTQASGSVQNPAPIVPAPPSLVPVDTMPSVSAPASDSIGTDELEPNQSLSAAPAETPTADTLPATYAPVALTLSAPEQAADSIIENAPEPNRTSDESSRTDETEERIRQMAARSEALSLDEWEVLAEHLTAIYFRHPASDESWHERIREMLNGDVQVVIPRIGAPPNSCEIVQGSRDSPVSQILRVGIIRPDGGKTLPRVLTGNAVIPARDEQEVVQ